ncbi:MAG: hypothetical protein V4538_15535 [Bacteroidota bacterium]
MNNEFECRFTFDLKPYAEPIYEVFSDGSRIPINFELSKEAYSDNEENIIKFDNVK